MKKSGSCLSVKTYAGVAIPHLQHILYQNLEVLDRIANQLVRDVIANRSLFVFGCGHAGLLPLEIYHRAGGPSFVIPLVPDCLLPSAGPSVVRLLERTEGCAQVFLDRAEPRPKEMIWLFSQSGINAAIVDFALEAKRRRLRTVAFTSTAHSSAIPSRHSSKKKLFEICDEVVDLGGVVGDAAVKINSKISMGPLSTLSGIFLAHSILGMVLGSLENKGIRCTYTSVNTTQGELRNRNLEMRAKIRDPLLR